MCRDADWPWSWGCVLTLGRGRVQTAHPSPLCWSRLAHSPSLRLCSRREPQDDAVVGSLRCCAPSEEISAVDFWNKGWEACDCEFVCRRQRGWEGFTAVQSPSDMTREREPGRHPRPRPCGPPWSSEPWQVPRRLRVSQRGATVLPHRPGKART